MYSVLYVRWSLVWFMGVIFSELISK